MNQYSPGLSPPAPAPQPRECGDSISIRRRRQQSLSKFSRACVEGAQVRSSESSDRVNDSVRSDTTMRGARPPVSLDVGRARAGAFDQTGSRTAERGPNFALLRNRLTSSSRGKGELAIGIRRGMTVHCARCPNVVSPQKGYASNSRVALHKPFSLQRSAESRPPSNDWDARRSPPATPAPGVPQ